MVLDFRGEKWTFAKIRGVMWTFSNLKALGLLLERACVGNLISCCTLQFRKENIVVDRKGKNQI